MPVTRPAAGSQHQRDGADGLLRAAPRPLVMKRDTMHRLLLLLVCAIGSGAALEHPYLLWTEEEAAAIRQRLADDPDAQAQLERMERSSMAKDNKVVWELFRYVVLQDEEAGAIQKFKLLDFIGRKPDPMTWDVDPKTLKWNEGMPSSGDSHMRDEQTLNTLRYDCVYHLLDEDERAGVEESLRSYIDFHLDGHKPWHPAFKYDRTSWLPNMHWPRAIGTHLMAVALGDEELIQAMFESQGGWQWFFDEYIADGCFYMEEFGKYYSNIGTMLMYCEALENIGLGQYGYGYTGAGGATMKRFLQMLPTIGLPRLEAPAGGRPMYPVVTMGDAGDLHHIIAGRGFRDGKGKAISNVAFWRGSRMNGPLPKLRQAGWFEVGHARWPDAGFDYFLAQMRGPDEERYLPSLYWNLRPIDPAAVTPPPAPSLVSRERGFALLRAEEGPAYWESPKPAVSQQFGMYYVHYVHDCFSILQFVANNRLLYNKMGRPKKRKGYAGGDDWKDHVRGHCGVVVDGLKAQPVDRGNDGCANQRIREDLAGPGRFSAVRAAGVYPGVDQERALLLCDEYLLDVFHLVAAEPRTYDWQILAYGERVADDHTWQPVAEWQGRDAERIHLHETQVFDAGDAAWQVSLQQDEQDRRPGVGVRIHMLGEADSLVLDSVPPGLTAEEATSLLVTRQKPATTFAAVHEPFADGPASAPLQRVVRIDESADAVGFRLQGAALDDRVLIAYGDGAEAAQTIDDEQESFIFTGFAFIRATPERITVQGQLQAMQLLVEGEPELVIGGETVAAEIADGVLRYGE